MNFWNRKLQYVLFKTQHYFCAYKDFHAQNNETNVNIEFLQPYPVVTADTPLQIATTIILAATSLYERLTQTLHLPRNVTTRCTVVLFGTLLSAYALLNALRFRFEVINFENYCSSIQHVRTFFYSFLNTINCLLVSRKKILKRNSYYFWISFVVTRAMKSIDAFQYAVI